MTTPAIEFEAVRKAYRFFTLSDLTFRLERGEIMGLVGPNGAGKTTTIRLLMGMAQQDAGTIRVHGHSIPGDQARAKWDVGFVAHDMGLFGSASLAWHLAFMRSIYPKWDDQYAALLLERFALHPEQRIKALSTGERVKAALLLVLARRPRLLVLDEPTAGLDPVARHEALAEIMEVLKDEQRSILLSSHHTADVEQICDRILFMDRGRIVDSNNKEDFLDRWRRLTVDVPGDADLAVSDGAISMVRTGHRAVITTNAYTEELEARYARAGAVIRNVQRLTLEEIFVATVLQNRKGRGQ